MSTTIAQVSKYAPGADITAEATAAVVAKTFLTISGDRTAGGNISVAPAAAGGRTCGVAGNDAAAGELVHVVRGNSRVCYVTTSGAIGAGSEVQVGAGGTATALGAGVAVGYAIAAAADATDAQISLY